MVRKIDYFSIYLVLKEILKENRMYLKKN